MNNVKDRTITLTHSVASCVCRSLARRFSLIVIHQVPLLFTFAIKIKSTFARRRLHCHRRHCRRSQQVPIEPYGVASHYFNVCILFWRRFSFSPFFFFHVLAFVDDPHPSSSACTGVRSINFLALASSTLHASELIYPIRPIDVNECASFRRVPCVLCAL